MINDVIIDVKNLYKNYVVKKNINEVLKGVSFQVKKGQVFSLLGNKGVGKTTIIHILATLTTLSEGDILICDYDLKTQAKEVRECISLTNQSIAIDEMFTGRENMFLISNLKHLKNYKSQVNELLELFELNDNADKLVKTYSNSMKRKIDIAMSLLGDPKIILLDEPTLGLDNQSCVLFWKIIENLKKQGKTIFIATTSFEEAKQHSDYIAVLDKGIIIAQGTPKELKNLMTEKDEKDLSVSQDEFIYNK